MSAGSTPQAETEGFEYSAEGYGPSASFAADVALVHVSRTRGERRAIRSGIGADIENPTADGDELNFSIKEAREERLRREGGRGVYPDRKEGGSGQRARNSNRRGGHRSGSGRSVVSFADDVSHRSGRSRNSRRGHRHGSSSSSSFSSSVSSLVSSSGSSLFSSSMASTTIRMLTSNRGAGPFHAAIATMFATALFTSFYFNRNTMKMATQEAHLNGGQIFLDKNGHPLEGFENRGHRTSHIQRRERERDIIVLPKEEALWLDGGENADAVMSESTHRGRVDKRAANYELRTRDKVRLPPTGDDKHLRKVLYDSRNSVREIERAQIRSVRKGIEEDERRDKLEDFRQRIPIDMSPNRVKKRRKSVIEVIARRVARKITGRSDDQGIDRSLGPEKLREIVLERHRKEDLKKNSRSMEEQFAELRETELTNRAKMLRVYEELDRDGDGIRSRAKSNIEDNHEGKEKERKSGRSTTRLLSEDQKLDGEHNLRQRTLSEDTKQEKVKHSDIEQSDEEKADALGTIKGGEERAVEQSPMGQEAAAEMALDLLLRDKILKEGMQSERN